MNHKHAAQCTDLYVSPKTLFMIKMVVLKSLNLTQVRAGLEDLAELVGVIPWGLHHHVMVSLDLCWVVLTKPMTIVWHRISSSNSISSSPGPAGTKFCTDLLLQGTIPALPGAHPWPTTHLPLIISLFPLCPYFPKLCCGAKLIRSAEAVIFMTPLPGSFLCCPLSFCEG